MHAQAQRQRAAALEVKRLEALPAFLAGRSFAPLDEEAEASPDLLVFEGASPAEIQRLADKWRQEKRAAAGGGGAGAALAGGAGQAAGLASRWGLPMSVVASDDDDPFEVRSFDGAVCHWRAVGWWRRPSEVMAAEPSRPAPRQLILTLRSRRALAGHDPRGD